MEHEEWEGTERNALDDGMPEEVVRAYKKAKESLKSVKTYAVMVSDKKGRMLKILNGESGELIRLHIASLQGLLEKTNASGDIMLYWYDATARILDAVERAEKREGEKDHE